MGLTSRRYTYPGSQPEPKRHKFNFNKIPFSFNPRIGLIVFVILLLVIIIWRVLIYVPKVKLTESKWFYSVETGGRMIADTIPVYSEYAGVIKLLVEDKSIVEKGQELIRIVDATKEGQLSKEIEKIKTELEGFNSQELEGALAGVEEPQGAPMTDLRRAVREYGIYQRQFAPAEIRKSYERIDKLEEEYYGYISTLTLDLQKYQALQTSLAQLEQDYAACSQTMLANISGSLSFTFDGLDAAINHDKGAKSFAELIEAKFADYATVKTEVKSIADGETIKIGQQVAAIYKKDSIYLIISIPEKMRANIALADSFDLAVDGVAVPSEMKEVSGNQGLYLFLVTEIPENLSIKRDVSVFVKTEELFGAKIPKTALFYEDEQAYVYLSQGKTTVKTAVTVLKELPKEYLIGEIDYGQKIIKNIKDIRG